MIPHFRFVVASGALFLPERSARRTAVFTLAMPFNTSGMYRRTVDADGKITVGIYR